MVSPLDLMGGSKSSKQPPTNIITLYHGSKFRDVVPTYGKGREDNDYGQGFYLTPDKELACEWAVGTSKGRDGWLHSYTLDLTDLRVFDFSSIKKFNALHWVATLMSHRRLDDESGIYMPYGWSTLIESYSIDVDSYDVITGWRADDSYFKYAADFCNNSLSYSLLDECMRLGNLGVQYCCKSERAFSALKKSPISPSIVYYSEYYPRYQKRDFEARRAYSDIAASSRNNRSGDLYMIDFVRRLLKGN